MPSEQIFNFSNNPFPLGLSAKAVFLLILKEKKSNLWIQWAIADA